MKLKCALFHISIHSADASGDPVTGSLLPLSCKVSAHGREQDDDGDGNDIDNKATAILKQAIEMQADSADAEA